jgi:hypothetical protein
MLGYLLGIKQALFANIIQYLTKKGTRWFRNRVNVLRQSKNELHATASETHTFNLAYFFVLKNYTPLKIMPNCILLPVCQAQSPRKKARTLN